jgi:hypothetical protein
MVTDFTESNNTKGLGKVMILERVVFQRENVREVLIIQNKALE